MVYIVPIIGVFGVVIADMDQYVNLWYDEISVRTIKTYWNGTS